MERIEAYKSQMISCADMMQHKHLIKVQISLETLLICKSEIIYAAIIFEKVKRKSPEKLLLK